MKAAPARSPLAIMHRPAIAARPATSRAIIRGTLKAWCDFPKCEFTFCVFPKCEFRFCVFPKCESNLACWGDNGWAIRYRQWTTLRRRLLASIYSEVGDANYTGASEWAIHQPCIGHSAPIEGTLLPAPKFTLQSTPVVPTGGGGCCGRGPVGGRA